MEYRTGIAEIDEGLEARFEILSPTVRQLLSGDSVPSLVRGCAQKFGLDEDTLKGIQNEIVYVLMFLEPEDNFTTNLITEQGISPDVALEIGQVVSTQLFAPIISELGHSTELPPEQEGEAAVEAPSTDTPATPVVMAAEPPAPITTNSQQAPVTTPIAPQAPAPHVPVARVMPQSPAAVQHDPKASTELPNALLQNLKASLMHGASEEPLEGTNPAPSYNAILNTKPPTPPQV